MAESSEGFKPQRKEAAFGAGVPGGGTPKIVEGSLVRPAGQTQLVPQRESGQGSNWFNHEMPYAEMVGHLQSLVDRERRKVAQAQAEFPDSPFTQKDPFNAAEWLGGELQRMSQHEGEHQEQYANLWRAWEALAYPHYTGKEMGIPTKNLARGDIELYVKTTKQTSLILSPSAINVLDAMAEVAGIPRTRGEATIDLTPFAPRNTDQQP